MPIPKRTAATARYQVVSGPEHYASSSADGLHAEHDAADGGDEQHDRRDLEGEQVVGEEEPADLGRAPERARDLGAVGEAAVRLGQRARRSTSIRIAAPTTNAPSWSQRGPPAQGASARPPR